MPVYDPASSGDQARHDVVELQVRELELGRYLAGTQKKQARFIFPPGAEQPADQGLEAWLTECVREFQAATERWKEGDANIDF